MCLHQFLWIICRDVTNYLVVVHGVGEGVWVCVSHGDLSHHSIHLDLLLMTRPVCSGMTRIEHETEGGLWSHVGHVWWSDRWWKLLHDWHYSFLSAITRREWKLFYKSIFVIYPQTSKTCKLFNCMFGIAILKVQLKGKQPYLQQC